MKKLLFISCIFLLCSFCFSDTINNEQASVWVCSSSNTYHKTSACKGIQSCPGKLQKLSMSAAKNQGKTACTLCYPQKKQAQKTQKSTSSSTTKKQATKTKKTTR